MKLSSGYLAAFACIAVLLAGGCATSTYAPPPGAPSAVKMPGVYHEVKGGETLWRIARIYNISVKELALANRISDMSQISSGQLLFIPGSTAVKATQPINDIAPSDFMWPVKGRVTSFFGATRDSIVNKGIDIKIKRALRISLIALSCFMLLMSVKRTISLLVIHYIWQMRVLNHQQYF